MSHGPPGGRVKDLGHLTVPFYCKDEGVGACQQPGPPASQLCPPASQLASQQAAQQNQLSHASFSAVDYMRTSHFFGQGLVLWPLEDAALLGDSTEMSKNVRQIPEIDDVKHIFSIVIVLKNGPRSWESDVAGVSKMALCSSLAHRVSNSLSMLPNCHFHWFCIHLVAKSIYMAFVSFCIVTISIYNIDVSIYVGTCFIIRQMKVFASCMSALLL